MAVFHNKRFIDHLLYIFRDRLASQTGDLLESLF